MEIKSLRDCPEFTEQVISWLNTEFGSPNSKEFYRGIVEHCIKGEGLPISFAAVENETLLGTVGVWRADLMSRQELYPWLSALVVAPQYRGTGIGKSLQQYAVDFCRVRGYKELFLYTDLSGYYEKSGWNQIGIGYEYSGNAVKLYSRRIDA